jgi:hypothetical protein
MGPREYVIALRPDGGRAFVDGPHLWIVEEREKS